MIKGIAAFLDTPSLSAAGGQRPNKLRAAKAGVEFLVAKARKLAKKNRLSDAIRLLEEAHQIVISAVTETRHNQTVIYALNFEKPADEYEYEKQRHSSYLMLLRLRRQARTPSRRMNERVDKLVLRSQKLGAHAAEQATANKHMAAIKSLEQATHQLIAALRVLGQSVP